MAKVYVILLLLLLLTPVRGNPVLIDINFRVESDSYDNFLNMLYEELANNPTNKKIEGHPVLAEQRVDLVPARWILVHLYGSDDKQTILAIRDDNIDLIGFTDKNNKWYAFKDKDHLIPGSTALSFGQDYKDLSSSHKELVNFDLGQTIMLEAVHTLREYDPSSIADDNLKHALTALIVMICETQRFQPVREQMSTYWEDGTRITETQASYLVNWSRISLYLLRWHRTGVWSPPNSEKKILQGIDVNNEGDALDVVELVLWPAKFEGPINVMNGPGLVQSMAKKP